MVICVDVDGTLTLGSPSWTEEDCLRAAPNLRTIRAINRLYQTNFIVIYTARRELLIPATLRWLRSHGVLFHAWAVGPTKCPADMYVDDKAIRPEELEVPNE